MPAAAASPNSLCKNLLCKEPPSKISEAAVLPQIADLLGGHVHVMFDVLPESNHPRAP